MGIIDLIMGWGIINEDVEVSEKEINSLNAIDKKENNKIRV